MEEFISVLKTQGILLVVTIIISYITAKITLNRKFDERIYEKREKLYIELSEIFDVLINNPYIIYNYDAFISPLKKLRIRMNLFASKAVILNFSPLYEEIMTIYESYIKLYNAEAVESRVEQLKQEVYDPDSAILLAMGKEEQYQEAHIMDENIFLEKAKQLNELMRKDMKAGK